MKEKIESIIKDAVKNFECKKDNCNCTHCISRKEVECILRSYYYTINGLDKQ